METSQRQRQAGVDDVLDDQHVPAGDVGVEVLEDPHDAGGLGARAVRRDRHPVHLEVPAEVPGQVGHHHHGAAEDADEQEVLARRSPPRSRAASSPSRSWICSSVKRTFDQVVLDVRFVHGVSLPQRSGRNLSEVALAERGDVAGQLDLLAADRARAARDQRRRARATWTRNSSAAGQPAASAASRSTRRRTRGGLAAERAGSRAAPSRAAVRARTRLGELVERVAVLAQLVGGAGQGRGDARARARASSTGSTRVPHPGPGERAGPRCAGRPSTRCPRPGRPPRSGRGSRRAAGGGSTSKPRRIPASDRPPRAAGQPEQHGLGLVVEGVPEQHDRGAEALGDLARARRTAPRRAAASGPWPAAVDARPGPRRSRRRRGAAICATTRAGVLGGAVLQPVVDGDPDDPPGRPAAPRRRWRRAAPASRRRPEQATSTGLPGVDGRPSARRTASRTAATAGSSAMAGAVSRARGAPRPPGRRSRPWWAGSPGSAQTALKSVHADLVDDARGRTRRRRGTAPSWRRGRAAGAAAGRACPAPLRRWLNFARIVVDRRDDLGPDAVHHHVGVALEQRHHRR